ncbi:hypothetical protein SEEM1674_10507, partial [Salmonella enterica subsp. enterica serovar Muenchen str. baa1674]
MQRLRRIADHDSPVSKHFRRRSLGQADTRCAYRPDVIR